MNISMKILIFYIPEKISKKLYIIFYLEIIILKENAYSLNSKEIIFPPNHTNEESGDNLLNSSSLDNFIEDNNYSLTKDSYFSISQTNEILIGNLSIFPSIDNYIKEFDYNLNCKDNNLSPSLINEESTNNSDNLFKNSPDIPSKSEILIEIASNNRQINISKITSSNRQINISKPFKIREKRGRKTEKSNSKFHDSSSDDNCLLKLQIHFFNFIIILTNEVLNNEDIKEKFILVDYKIKKQVNHDFFCELKDYSIKDILEKDTSSKYRSRKSDFNRETLKKIYLHSNYSDWLNDFFNINYLKLFSEYYHNNEEPLQNLSLKKKKLNYLKHNLFIFYLIIKIIKVKKLKRI